MVKYGCISKYIWAASWQNQQCGCAPSEDSDQPGHSPNLITVFAVRMKKAWVLSYPLSAQRRYDQTGRMLRLIWVFAGCTVILFVLSWGGSYEPRHEKTCFALCEQQRRRSACASAQSDQHLCCSLPGQYMYNIYIQNFKPLASFCDWAGQFESYLVANPGFLVTRLI